MPRPLATAAFVLICLCLGAVAGATVASTRPADYRADATMLVRGTGIDRLLDPGGLELSLDDAFSEDTGSAAAPAALRSLLRAASPPPNPAQTVLDTAKLDAIAQLAEERSSSQYSASQYEDAIEPTGDSARGTVTITAKADTAALSSNLANSYADTLAAYLSDGQAGRLRDLKLALRRISADADSAGLASREARALKRLADDSYAKLRLLESTFSTEPPATVLIRANGATASEDSSVAAGAAIGAALGLLAAALLLGLRQLRRASTSGWASDPARELGAPVLATMEVDDVAGRLPRDVDQLPPPALALARAVSERLEHSGARTVAVSSARDEALTKPVAWALACHFAEAHERVLLVEASTGKSGLAEIHGLDPRGGLAALDEFAADDELAADRDAGADGAAPPAEEPRAPVETVALAGGRSIDVVAAGQDERLAEELASDPVLESFLDDAVLRYNRVVLEAPAGAEVAALAAKLRHVVVLARVGSVSRRAVRAELAALRRREAEVLGLVVVRAGGGAEPAQGERARPDPVGAGA